MFRTLSVSVMRGVLAIKAGWTGLAHKKSSTWGRKNIEIGISRPETRSEPVSPGSMTEAFLRTTVPSRASINLQMNQKSRTVPDPVNLLSLPCLAPLSALSLVCSCAATAFRYAWSFGRGRGVKTPHSGLHAARRSCHCCLSRLYNFQLMAINPRLGCTT